MALAESVGELPGNAPWEVPDGWAWVPLKRLSSFIGRGRGPTYVEAGGVPVVNQKCIRWRRLEAKHFKLTARQAFDRLAPELHLKAGDLLWNSTGTGTIGRALIYDGSFPELTIDSHVTLVRPNSVLPAYLGYFVETMRVQRLVVDGHVGSTNQQELPRSFVEDLLIPLPPPAEQRRIVARIDALFAEIAEGEAALAAARKGLDTFRRALLRAAITGKLTVDWRVKNRPTETGHDLLARIKHDISSASKGRTRRAARTGPPEHSELPAIPESWAWTTLDQVGEIISGQTPSGIEKVIRPEGEVPWFKVSSMNDAGADGMLTTSQWNLSRDEVKQVGLRVVPVGAICFPKRGGSILTNKKRRLGVPGTLDLNVMAYASHQSLRDYAWLYFMQLDLRRIFDGSNVPQINYGDIAYLPIAIPPPAEVSEISRRVYEALSAATDVLTVLEAEASDTVRLKQSILKAAFEGRLVPQDPADEPAGALLARLSAPAPEARRGRGGRTRAK